MAAMIEAIKRKKGTVYRVKVRGPDRRLYPQKTFATKTEARRYERTLLQLKDQGQAAKPKAVRTLTIQAYWQVWTEHCRKNTSDGWRISQDQMVRDYIDPVIGDTKLTAIKPIHVQRVMNRMHDLGRGGQTRRHVYNLLHRLFEDAVHTFEFIDRNPVLKGDRPKVSTPKRNYLTPAEAWRLLNHCRDHFLGPAIWIATLSALRPSEIQALRVGSVKLEIPEIQIKEAFKRKINRIEPFPKQKEWGSAPIPPQLLDYLRPRIAPREPGDFAAPGLKGGMLKYNIFLDGLKRFCRELKITEVTPHELRHTATEIYFHSGASAEDVRRLLNHASLNATKSYIHHTPERLLAIASQIKSTCPSPNLHAVK